MITPINYRQLVLYRQNKVNNSPKKQNVSFCARPEFDMFVRQFSNLNLSRYFRRDQPIGVYSDVVQSIKLVYSNVKKPKILVVGVADAQEPFSILTVIKTLNKDKPLKSVVDLNCVDFKPKIAAKDLEKYSYLDSSAPPQFAKEGFELDADKRCKVKPEVFKYLNSVFGDSDKAKFDTKIEEFSAQCPEKTYDMIFVNNVLGYIQDENAREATMINLSKMLKPNGVLNTDVYDDIYRDFYPCLNRFKNINPGIWQKRM